MAKDRCAKTATSQDDANAAAQDLSLLRPESIARQLGISPRTLRRWIASERFPPADFVITEKIKLWRRQSVERWLDQYAQRQKVAGHQGQFSEHDTK